MWQFINLSYYRAAVILRYRFVRVPKMLKMHLSVRPGQRRRLSYSRSLQSFLISVRPGQIKVLPILLAFVYTLAVVVDVYYDAS